MEAEQPWSQADYIWNPFRLAATPASEGQGIPPVGPPLLPPVTAAATVAADFSASVRYGSGLAPLAGLDPMLDPRQRTRASGVCQVDDCDQSLKQLKEYHQRYKICEHHLKVSSIIREGVRQRFCQQCGRFHDLSEFDGDKRSCRARLQRHNARRRKKTDADAALKVTGAPRKSGSSFRRASTSPTTRETGFGRPTRHSATHALHAMLDEQEARDAAQAVPCGQYAASRGNAGSCGAYGGILAKGGHLSLENALSELLQESQSRHQGISLAAIQEFLDDGQRGAATSSAGPSSRIGATAEALAGMPDMGNEGNNFGPDPSAAFGELLLPLGSSLGGGASGMPPPSSGLDLFAMQKQAFLGSYSSGKGSGLGANMNFTGMHVGGFGPLSTSFSAPPLPRDRAGGLRQDAEPDAVMLQASSIMGSQGVPAFAPVANGARSLSEQSTGTTMAGEAGLSQALQQPASSGALAAGPSGASVLREAHALLANGGYQSQYDSATQLTRMSAKLFNCTPDHLPSDLKGQLVGLLQCGSNSLQGYIRPGCTHLTVNALLTEMELARLCAGGIRVTVQALLDSPSAGSFWKRHSFMLQLLDEVALVRDGRVLHVLSCTGSHSIFPAVSSVSPRFVSPEDEAVLQLTGSNLLGPNNYALARSGGKYVDVVVADSAASVEGLLGSEGVTLKLTETIPPGAIFVEMAHGGFLSSAAPLLMLPDAAVASELRQLEGDGQTSEVELQAIILDLDCVLQYQSALRAATAEDQPPQAAAARTLTETDVAAACTCAQKLLVLACSKGWPLLACLVLPTACAAAESVGDVMDALEQRVPGHLTPLHLAVRSGSADLVRLLLGWATAGGYEWDVAVAGTCGITPLHLAALLPNAAIITSLLTGHSAAGKAVLLSTKAEDGSTPADFASQAGNGPTYFAASPSQETELMAAFRSKKAISVGSDDMFEEEEALKKPSTCAGGKATEERRRGRLHMPRQLYRDYYMDCDIFGLAFAPTVFDCTSSACTAAIIVAAGGATLLLRHLVDTLGL